MRKWEVAVQYALVILGLVGSIALAVLLSNRVADWLNDRHQPLRR